MEKKEKEKFDHPWPSAVQKDFSAIVLHCAFDFKGRKTLDTAIWSLDIVLYGIWFFFLQNIRLTNKKIKYEIKHPVSFLKRNISIFIRTERLYFRVAKIKEHFISSKNP